MVAPIKRFGPIHGPGVGIIEKPAQSAILPNDLGGAVLIGTFLRGTVNTTTTPALNKLTGKGAMKKKMGGRLVGTTTPDAIEDYFDHSQGAGAVYAVRVTDGLEVASEVTLYSRHWGTAFAAPIANKDNQTQVKVPVFKIAAKNGGRWGGRLRILDGDVANVATDITALTLITGLTMKKDEWKGATIAIEGIANKTYEVVSNSTAGVLTVTTGSDMDSDFGASANKHYTVTLKNEALTTGGRRSVAVRVKEATLDPANEFGIEIYVDGQLVGDYPDASVDSLSARYFPSLVAASDANDEITVTDQIAAGTAIIPDLRPAAFYAMPSAVAALQITFPLGQVKSNDDTTNIKIVNIQKTSADPIPHRLTFTWDANGNLYTVVATDLVLGLTIKSLPDFAVGNGPQVNKVYDPGTNKPSVKVTVDHIAEPANGKTFVLDILPLPKLGSATVNSLVGGFVLPDAKSKPLTAFRISEIDTNLVKIAAGDLSVDGLAPAQAVVVGTNTAASVSTVGANRVDLIINGRTIVNVALTENAAHPKTTIVTEINTAFGLVFGAGVLSPASVDSQNRIVFTSNWYEGGGAGSTVEVVTVASNAYGAAVLGLTVGVTSGVNGKEVRLDTRAEMSGGYDGDAPAAQRYIDALDISLSPVNQLVGTDAGMLQICAPGNTTTSILKQGILYAEAKNYLFVYDVPEATITDEGAVTYVDTTIGRSDHAATYFPSMVKVRDPDKDGPLKVVSAIPMILGLDAKYARGVQGYHQPAAGTDAKLPRIVSLPTGKRVLDEETLTKKGVNVLKFKGAGAIVWGARTVGSSVDFRFKAHRLQLSHYEHTIVNNFDFVIFALNDPETRALLKSVFRTFFEPEVRKRAIKGPTVDDGVSIKIDAENNSPLDEANGDLNVELRIALVGIVERLLVSVSKAGIFESTST